MQTKMTNTIDYANLEEKMIKLNRVAKVVKGGRRFAFSALMVVGDRHGHVGIGYGKATEVPEAIRKGIENAKKNMIKVPMQNTTIPHEILAKYNSAKVFLKPATEGSGIVAGAPVRAVIEVSGIRDILSKSLGSSNQLNIAKATFEALKNLRDMKTIAARRGKSLQSMYGKDAADSPEETSNEETAVEASESVSAAEGNDASAEAVTDTASASAEKVQE